MCDERHVTDYVKYCTVLVAYAESRFRISAIQRDTIGVFQQNPKWWKGDLLDVRHATNLFLDAFTPHPEWRDPVYDVWHVQRWEPPNLDVPYDDWFRAPETKNYTNVLGVIGPMVASGVLPLQER